MVLIQILSNRSATNDMRIKAIDQLEKSLHGLCNVDISIENHETIEIVPPINRF